jgi:hypothetical protein
MPDDLIERIVAAIRRHPAIREVNLVGSRLDGTAGPLSDWDFKIETAEPERVFGELPAIVSAFRPLAAFWDPLGGRSNYMVTFAGPLVLDLHVDLQPLPPQPWRVGPDTLANLDSHFWNWSLWLAGKSLKRKNQHVAQELQKMSRYLLRPLGCPKVPADLAEAVAEYAPTRERAEARYGVRVSGNPLEVEVRRALVRHGLI